MSGQWKEVVSLAFKGQRFRDHALDLSAVTELSQFQKLVAETAKSIWRTAHPDRERIPKNFEDRTRLCLRRIDEGSAVAPLEVFVEDLPQPGLFEPEPIEVQQAVELTDLVFRAVENDESLPESFPKALISEYEKLGQTLNDDEAIEVIHPGLRHGAQPARITRATRERLTVLAEHSYEDCADITGEVLEADVRQCRFQLWLDEKTGITVSFSPEQEVDITAALRDHRSVRVQVVGMGEFSPQGKPVRITRVDKLKLQPIGATPLPVSSKPIEDVLIALAREVPEKEWENLPADLTNNLDHYLYGIPKQ